MGAHFFYLTAIFSRGCEKFPSKTRSPHFLGRANRKLFWLSWGFFASQWTNLTSHRLLVCTAEQQPPNTPQTCAGCKNSPERLVGGWWEVGYGGDDGGCAASHARFAHVLPEGHRPGWNQALELGRAKVRAVGGGAFEHGGMEHREDFTFSEISSMAWGVEGALN